VATTRILGTIWLVTTAACCGCMWPPPGDSTELTDETAKVVHLNVSTVMHSCCTGPTDRYSLLCTISIITLMMTLAGRNRLVLHFLYSTVTHTELSEDGHVRKY